MRPLRRAWLMVVLVALLGSSVAQAAEEITLYTYHNHPPFITQPGVGLSHDLVALLNRKADGAFHFSLKVVPRTRLNAMLKQWVNGACLAGADCEKRWAIPWVNQKWGFGKSPEQNFGWKPLLQDSNVIISSSSAPIEYQQPSDLDQKRFAGVGGHRYVGIDERVKQGKITRIDGNKERGNLIILSRGRVDATLLPGSAYDYYINKDDQLSKLSSRLHRAKTPQHSYMRNLMTPANYQSLNQRLSSIDFENDGAWQALLQSYGLGR